MVGCLIKILYPLTRHSHEKGTFSSSLAYKEKKQSQKKSRLEVEGPTMSSQTSLFRMQIISEFLISINA